MQVLSRRLRLAGDFDFRVVAKRTPGFVGADLQALMKESAALAVKRIFRELEAAAAAAEAEGGVGGAATGEHLPGTPGAVPAPQQEAQQEAERTQDVQQPASAGDGSQQAEGREGQEPAPAGAAAAAAPAARRLGGGALSGAELAGLAITMADFEEAIPKVQPSVRREGFATTPDVTWDDVGSLGDVREELAFAITQPVAHPEVFEAMGLRPATGVLLFGPPGGRPLQGPGPGWGCGRRGGGKAGWRLLSRCISSTAAATSLAFLPYGCRLNPTALLPAHTCSTRLRQDVGGQGGGRRVGCQLYLHQGTGAA